MPFTPCEIRINPRRLYARAPLTMAQFVLKIAKLSHIIRILENGVLICRSLFPIMVPSTDMQLQHLFFDSAEELSRQGYFQWITLFSAGTFSHNNK